MTSWRWRKNGKTGRGLPAARRTDPDVVDLRWQIEELRVSFFAQRLGTAGPVSIKRIFKAMDSVEDATAR